MLKPVVQRLMHNQPAGQLFHCTLENVEACIFGGLVFVFQVTQPAFHLSAQPTTWVSGG